MPESNWLERELQTALGPVAAPAGLWNRMGKSREPHARRFVLPAIAVLMLVASADLLWTASQARIGLNHTEIAKLVGSSEQCDLWSGDPAHIRQWVKSRTGIELELPAHSPSVRMVGAKVVSLRGRQVASVAYENADHRGNMLIWKEGHEHTKHAAPIRTAGLISWSQGDNVFAVSTADEVAAKGACMLCHTEGTHGI